MARNGGLRKEHSSSRRVLLNEELEKEYRERSILRSLRSAVPIAASESSRPTHVVMNWVGSLNRKNAAEDFKGPGTEAVTKQRVGLISMFSYATTAERWWMVFGLFWALVSGLSMPAWLLLLGQSLETFNELGALVASGQGDIAKEKLIDQLYQLSWSFAVVGAVSLVAGTMYVAIWTYTGESQATRIKDKFVRGAFRQDAAWFDQRGDPQELPTLAANALSQINDAIGRQLADAFSNLVSSICCLVVAIFLDAPLAFLMLCILPIIAVVIGIISVFMRKRNGQALEKFAEAGGFATEVLSGIKTVASLSAESWAANKYDGVVQEAQKYSIWTGILSSLSAGVMSLLFYCTYTVAFILGSEQVARTLAAGEEFPRNPLYCIINDCGIHGSYVMICVYGVMLSAQFFSLMTPGIRVINLGRQAAVDIFDAINRVPEINPTSEEGKKLVDFNGGIEFNRVAFAYPSRPKDLIFNGFGLKVQPGSSVALVGPSGSGKSTISKLLLRLYDPIGGAVLADGVPLKDVNLKWWRSQIGYVPQEPSLFPGSIRDNIAMGKPEEDGPATDEEIVAAAKVACAHEFITALSDGYNTFYNGASITFSGGQMQRIAIARAIIRNPSILLLDEATSALDSNSEKLVQEAIENIRATKTITTVTVAHRLSTIVKSDQIAVIADGWVQELGTHEKLLAQGGIYASLCKAQGITRAASRRHLIGIPEKSEVLPEQAVTNVQEVEVDIETGLDAQEGETNKGSMHELPATEEEVADMSRLWEYNRPERNFLFLGILGAIMVGVLAPVEGILFAKLTANFFLLDSEGVREENYTLSFYFLILAGISLLGSLALGCGFSISGYRLTKRMRVLVFERIMRHGIAWFDYPNHSTGELTSRLEEDAEAVSKVTGFALGQQIQVIVSLTTGVVIALSYSWQIGLITIGCIPWIMFAAVLQAKCTKKSLIAEEEGLSAATIFERGLSEIYLIQAYNQQKNVSDQYSNALKPEMKSKVQKGKVSGFVYGFSQMAIFTTFSLIFWAGLRFMVKGELTPTEFFTSLLSVIFAALSAGQVNADFTSRRKGLIAAARIFAIVDEPVDNDDPLDTSGTEPSSLDGSITYKSCEFTYPTRQENPVYYATDEKDGFNLKIGSKQSCAFVGRSGCGKSTALQLLLRFYSASSGEVLLDENNVQNLKLSWLRDKIGYVGQQPVLFAGSIRDNILLGKPDATMEEIETACKAANAHEFIERLSDGYATDIGAGGSLLSGGQKQRIAIARAIIKNPPILVLDEATSALDNESEKIVQSTLDEMQKNNPRTTLVVAHRLTTVKDCDQIAVLDDGGVQELGDHSSLLEQKGLYHSLWMKQVSN